MSELVKINAPNLFRFIIGPGKEIYSESSVIPGKVFTTIQETL
jgi:hypothetical protein